MLKNIRTKRKLKDENIHLHSLVRHLQIELENARLDISIKNDVISGYKNENIRLRQRINSMYVYDVFGEEV
jgi:hypothetical protein|nr:MAG TPA: hypothetical protein [Caudoviricetes sp.]